MPIPDASDRQADQQHQDKDDADQAHGPGLEGFGAGGGTGC